MVILTWIGRAGKRKNKRECSMPRSLLTFLFLNHRDYLKKRLYTNSRINAPSVAVMMLPMFTPVAPPKPRIPPRKPPTNAPAIPSSIVAIQPPPSFPGMSHFASAPAIPK